MHHDQPFPPSTAAAVDHLDLRGETVGIVAGWGRYPVMVAEAVRRHGGRTAILEVRGHADADLRALADIHGTVGLAQLGGAAVAAIVFSWLLRARASD